MKNALCVLSKIEGQKNGHAKKFKTQETREKYLRQKELDGFKVELRNNKTILDRAIEAEVKRDGFRLLLSIGGEAENWLPKTLAKYLNKAYTRESPDRGDQELRDILKKWILRRYKGQVKIAASWGSSSKGTELKDISYCALNW